MFAAAIFFFFYTKSKNVVDVTVPTLIPLAHIGNYPGLLSSCVKSFDESLGSSSDPLSEVIGFISMLFWTRAVQGTSGDVSLNTDVRNRHIKQNPECIGEHSGKSGEL